MTATQSTSNRNWLHQQTNRIKPLHDRLIAQCHKRLSGTIFIGVKLYVEEEASEEAMANVKETLKKQ